MKKFQPNLIEFKKLAAMQNILKMKIKFHH